MALTKARKSEILTELVQKFKEAKSIGFASSSTINVAEFCSLRKDLREVGATYHLAKKTLIKKAIKEALNIDIELSSLPGQIGVVCSNDDPVAGLGKVNDLVNKTKEKKITWALSIFDGEVKDLQATKTIAGLPSKDVLLGRLVGSLQSPIAGLARFFDAARGDLETKGKSKVGDLGGEETKKDTQKTETASSESATQAE